MSEEQGVTRSVPSAPLLQNLINDAPKVLPAKGEDQLLPQPPPEEKEKEEWQNDLTLEERQKVMALLKEELAHPKLDLLDSSPERNSVEDEFIKKILKKLESRKGKNLNKYGLQETLNGALAGSTQVKGKLMKMILAAIASYNFQSRRIRDLHFKSRKQKSNYICGSDTCKERAFKIRKVLMELLLEYPPEALAEIGVINTFTRSLKYIPEMAVNFGEYVQNFGKADATNPDPNNEKVPLRNTMYSRAFGGFDEYVDEKGRPLQYGWRRTYLEGTDKQVYVRTLSPFEGKMYWVPETRPEYEINDTTEPKPASVIIPNYEVTSDPSNPGKNIIIPNNKTSDVTVPLVLLPDGFEAIVTDDERIFYYDTVRHTSTVDWDDYFIADVKGQQIKVEEDIDERHNYPNMLPPGKEPVYAVDILRLSKAKNVLSAAEKIGANLKVLPSTLKRYGKDFFDKSKNTVVSSFNEFGNALVGDKLKGGKVTRRLRSTKPRKKSRLLYRRS